MADEQTPSSSQDRRLEGRRGGRPGGPDQGGREPGGFRIRLSDNEMRAARAIQEAFQLRSTVAALGFALRTTAQLLEDGQLDQLVEQQRSQAPSRGEGRRSDGPRGSRRDGRFEGRGEGRSDRAPRIDPFARPARPAAPKAVEAPVGDALPEDQVAAAEGPADVPAEAPELSGEAEATADQP